MVVLGNEFDLDRLMAELELEKNPRRRDSILLALMGQRPNTRNFRDFSEKFLRIVERDGTLDRFVLNRPQRRLEAALERQRRRGRPRRLAVPKARQEGVSTYSEAKVYTEVATKPNRTGLVIAHKMDSSVSLFAMMQRFQDNLPLKPDMTYSNRKELKFADPINSRVVVESAENRNAGRGMTPQLVHCSEVAFWPDAVTTMTGFQAGVPKNSESLIILESTGNGVGGWFYETCMLAAEGKSQYELFFLPWFALDEYRMPAEEGMTLDMMDLDAEEQLLVNEHGVDIEQLTWRRWTILEYGGNMESFSQEFPANLEECFQSRGAPVFRPGVIKDQLAAALVNPPKHRGSVRYEEGAVRFASSNSGPLLIWEMPIAGRNYCIGVDSGMGYASSDYSVACVLDGVTGEQVAELSGRYDSVLWAEMVVALGMFYNYAYLCIEVNNHGLYVVNAVMDAGYPNLFHRQTWEPKCNEWQEKVGWMTTVKTRPVMVDYAVSHFHNPDEPVIVRSKEALSQMSRFQFGDDGRPAVPKGEHDDHLFAWLLALQAFKFQSRASGPQETKRQYTGEDAWVWKSLDAKIRSRQNARRSRRGPIIGGGKW